MNRVTDERDISTTIKSVMTYFDSNQSMIFPKIPVYLTGRCRNIYDHHALVFRSPGYGIILRSVSSFIK